ncbi:MAG: formylglycine-generating enzyme family protein [Sandaracinaceae bacterium]
MRSLHVLLALALGACSGSADPDPRAEAPSPAPAAVDESPSLEPPSPEPTAPPPSVERGPRAPLPRAGDTTRIEAGSFAVGSLPGTPNRRPSVEADLVEIALPAFEIDRLPYPNDPGEDATQVATRAEAASLCEARGQRLCHELEWERACQGEAARSFATGESLDLAACVENNSDCPSPDGVFDMGMRAPEWTASDAEDALSRLDRTAVVRGARANDPLHLHRCSARQVKNPAGDGRAAAFRCCRGDAPEMAYPDVGPSRPFRELEHDQAAWRRYLAQIPELAQYADTFEPYGEEQALRALARGDATEEDLPWQLARGPFSWSPGPGEEVWLVTGRAGERTIIAAMYPLTGGGVRHAASFVLDDEVAPVALLRTPNERREILWSTCWSCMGESGAIRFDDDATIAVLQR